MPRKARLDIPGALHHIIVRGNDRSDIFRDEEDRAGFLDRLGKNVGEAQASVYAWVLMRNHVHILFKSGRKGISEVMRKLLTWYAIYFNRRHRRTGHLFENRYKSILCEEETYLLALIRYIHLNPIRAGIISSIGELDSYPWSGHSEVIGKKKCEWMDTDYILKRFTEKRKDAAKRYRQFVADGIPLGRISELSGGGLIRSMGGWSQVLSLRRAKLMAESDERVLGSSEFVNEILKETDEREQRQLKLRLSGRTIQTIIAEECKSAKVNPSELKNGSRRSEVSAVRASIAQKGIDELGLSMAEIARHLGVNTSSVVRAVRRRGKERDASYAT